MHYVNTKEGFIINKSQKASLPPELETYRNEIEDTFIPAVTVIPCKGATTLTTSKFGGTPYLPKAYVYPKDTEGTPMRLLAQINFSELPHIESFPEKGLLQIFVSPNILYIEEKRYKDIFQQYFKVRYFANPKATFEVGNSETALVPGIYSSGFPITEELALHFNLNNEPISALDYRLIELIGQDFSDNQSNLTERHPIEDTYMQYYLGAGHKVGGYPYFIDKDVRAETPFLKKYDTLLLQIDSNDTLGIMWGDSGVANFFISEENLRNRDFSDILFHWEQYSAYIPLKN